MCSHFGVHGGGRCPICSDRVMVLVVCNMDSMTALNQKHLGKGCSALFPPPSRLGMARGWLSSPKCHVGAADSVAPIGLQHPYTSEVCVPIQLSHMLLSMRRSMGGGGGSTLFCAFLPGAGSQEQHP